MTRQNLGTVLDYEHALVGFAILLDAPEGSWDLAWLEAFSIAIEKYEDEHYPIAAPDPIEAIKFRMEQAELRKEDLVPCIGSLSMVSEILEGKQPLTTEMAMALGKTFGIPIDIVGSTQTTKDGHWKVSE